MRINVEGSETSSSTTQLPEGVLPSPSPHAVNEVFPSTTSHESGEQHEDITDTESEDSIDTQDGGNELPQSPPEVIE